jgi:hypothetical protein
LRLTVTVEMPPFETTLPWELRPAPLTEMSWPTADLFSDFSVTLPAVAVADGARNRSWPVGSASISRVPAFSTAGFDATVCTAVARSPVSLPPCPATSAT